MFRASLGTRGEARRAQIEAETALHGRVRPWTRKPAMPCPLAPHVIVPQWVRAADPPVSPIKGAIAAGVGRKESEAESEAEREKERENVKGMENEKETVKDNEKVQANVENEKENMVEEEVVEKVGEFPEGNLDAEKGDVQSRVLEKVADVGAGVGGGMEGRYEAGADSAGNNARVVGAGDEMDEMGVMGVASGAVVFGKAGESEVEVAVKSCGRAVKSATVSRVGDAADAKGVGIILGKEVTAMAKLVDGEGMFHADSGNESEEESEKPSGMGVHSTEVGPGTQGDGMEIDGMLDSKEMTESGVDVFSGVQGFDGSNLSAVDSSESSPSRNLETVPVDNATGDSLGEEFSGPSELVGRDDAVMEEAGGVGEEELERGGVLPRKVAADKRFDQVAHTGLGVESNHEGVLGLPHHLAVGNVSDNDAAQGQGVLEARNVANFVGPTATDFEGVFDTEVPSGLTGGQHFAGLSEPAPGQDSRNVEQPNVGIELHAGVFDDVGDGEDDLLPISNVNPGDAARSSMPRLNPETVAAQLPSPEFIPTVEMSRADLKPSNLVGVNAVENGLDGTELSKSQPPNNTR